MEGELGKREVVVRWSNKVTVITEWAVLHRGESYHHHPQKGNNITLYPGRRGRRGGVQLTQAEIRTLKSRLVNKY